MELEADNAGITEILEKRKYLNIQFSFIKNVHLFFLRHFKVQAQI